MTVFELHLAIDQKLQEQGSFKRDRIYPEAKDIALNEAMFSVLDEITEINFADRELRLQALQNITVKNQEQVVDAVNKRTLLPADFYSGINYRVRTIRDKNSCSGKPDVPLTAYSQYYVDLFLPEDLTSPYYSRVQIQSTQQGFIYNQIFKDLYSLQQQYIVMASILDKFHGPVYAYWKEGVSFRLMSNTYLATVNLFVYKPDYSTPDASLTVANSILSTQIYNDSSLPSSYEAAIVPAKILEPDIFYKTDLNSFTRSKLNEPHATMLNGYLYLKEGESFIITNVYLDYIRRPKRISLALGQSCELAGDSIQQRVINRAIEILKNDIKDPSVSANLQYNELRTRT